MLSVRFPNCFPKIFAHGKPLIAAFSGISDSAVSLSLAKNSEKEMAFPTAGEIIDLIKKGATIEWQEKVMQLRQAAVDQQGVIIELREEIQKLQAQLKELKSGEHCPKCKIGNWQIKRSVPDPRFGRMGVLLREYRCDACGFSEQHQFDSKKSA